MEETREAAMAYYTNSSEETKKLAKNFFHNMDKDQDGKISIKDFDEYLKEKSPRLKSVSFSEIDKDGDGFLDFEEVIVFYYIAKFRRFTCDVCKTSLKGVFFTCTECFLKGSYDICLSCYQTVKFKHEHKVFLDNYAMLDLAQNELSKKKGSKKKGVGRETLLEKTENNMEGTREVALAYYANTTEEIKKTAKDFFNSIDTDGNGKISIQEFQDFLKEKSPRLKSVKFADLDRDGDGYLDFEEVIVFYYIANFRNYRCDVCRNLLDAVFFTCRNCFLNEDGNDSYDLCLTCYGTKKFNHEHVVFLDNHAMLHMSWKNLKEAGKDGRREKRGSPVSFGLNLDVGDLCQFM